jgi:hypothetical protein
MLIRFAVARNRAKIWTTIGSASHSLARDSCLRGDAGKMAALPLACPPVCFWRLVALPAANCETHQRLRRVSAGHTTKTRVGRSTPSKLRGRSRDCFSEMQTELVRSTTAALRTSANARSRCDDTVCSVRATSRAFPKFESYGMSETAAFRGWKAQNAIEWFHGIGRLGARPDRHRGRHLLHGSRLRRPLRG